MSTEQNIVTDTAPLTIDTQPTPIEGIKEIHNGAGYRLALRGTQRGLR